MWGGKTNGGRARDRPGKGIGAAVACRFAADGADLVLLDIARDALTATAEELFMAGAEVEMLVGSGADQAMCRQAVATAIDAFSALELRLP